MSRADQRHDARGGRYVMLPHAVLKSDAWRSAGLRERAILLIILQRFTGFNNGRIALSVRDAAAELGNQNYGATAAAIGGLVARGLIAVTADHPSGSRLAREYRLTFIETGERGRVAAATNEYLSWRPGDAGGRRRKSRREETSTRNGLSAEETSAEAKSSVEEAATRNCKTPGFPSVGPEQSVEETSSHIPNQSPPPSIRLVRDHCNGAAPPSLELRERLTRFLVDQPYGAQGRLAKRAGLTDSDLSRFRHGHDLSAAKRVRLACALPAAVTAEQGARPAPPARAAGAAR